MMMNDKFFTRSVVGFCAVALTFLLSLPAHALVDENACVPDVEAQFRNLNQLGSNLAARVNGVMPGRAFTQAPLAVFGYENHLQGIQRLHNKPYVLVSAGDWWHRKGYVFIIKLGTKDAGTDQPFGTNVSKKVMPPKADGIVGKLNIGDKLHWHPGGLGSSGDIVAVTAEEFMKEEAGKIFFYDFSDPEHPKEIAPALDRGKGKAGTVDLFKQSDGHYVVFTYTGGLLYFYRSFTTNIADGFDPASEQQVAHDGGGAVNVVKQCDGQIYLLSYDNTAHVAPIQKGMDQAFLTKLTFTKGIEGGHVDKVTQVDMLCDGYCNFAGAAGSFVSNDGKLSIYSSNFYRNYWGTKLKFKEFSQKD